MKIFSQSRCRSVLFSFFILRIHLIPGFIDSEQADWMFEQLLQDIPWGQRTHIRQGKECVDPLFRSFTGQFHNRICVWNCSLEYNLCLELVFIFSVTTSQVSMQVFGAYLKTTAAYFSVSHTMSLLSTK